MMLTSLVPHQTALITYPNTMKTVRPRSINKRCKTLWPWRSYSRKHKKFTTNARLKSVKSTRLLKKTRNLRVKRTAWKKPSDSSKKKSEKRRPRSVKSEENFLNTKSKSREWFKELKTFRMARCLTQPKKRKLWKSIRIKWKKLAYKKSISSMSLSLNKDITS